MYVYECVCAGDAVAQADSLSAEQRLAHAEMLVSLPVQPRLTGNCLTHGLALMHMKESTISRNRNSNYLFVCVRVCVCMFMSIFSG